MNNVSHDCSTEDEGVDEDMMFEFEEELDARLTLQDGARPESVNSSPAADRRSPYPFVPDAMVMARPQNPVAALLQSANDAEDAAFASLSASPFGECGSPMRMAALSATEANDKPPCFDFNGRRKRKYFDDSCCVTPRVRPLAKRAKSFSSVDSILNQDCSSKSTSSPSFAPNVIDESKPVTTAAPVVTGSFFSSTRSSSIQIPRRAQRAATHHHHQRSWSGPARGTAHSAKELDLPAASSDPLMARSSSSWNASVEYFCRRSLDISSPLRIRFRDLVVGSVGRAGSLKSP